jgi:hypothetical protein
MQVTEAEQCLRSSNVVYEELVATFMKLLLDANR